MNAAEFNIILEERLEAARKTLGAKAEEYASDKDRLHNFENAAKLQETDRAGALGGMMIKHTISVYDMINHGDTTDYSLAQWEEKIGDHLNYLILLMAVVVDDRSKMPVASIQASQSTEEFTELQQRLHDGLVSHDETHGERWAAYLADRERRTLNNEPWITFAAFKRRLSRNIGDNNAENL